MTVQQLIDRLQTVEDKTQPVYVYGIKCKIGSTCYKYSTEIVDVDTYKQFTMIHIEDSDTLQ